MTAERPTAATADERRADSVLRCAWLRGVAHRLREPGQTLADPDEPGQIAAQLLDLADLIEVAEQEGWWDQ